MKEKDQKELSVDERVKLIAIWFLGFIFIVGGLASISESGLLSGFLGLLSGIFILPPVAEQANKLLRGKFGFSAQFFVVFTLIALSSGLSTSKPEEAPLTIEQVEQIVQQALDERAQAEIDAAKLPATTPAESAPEETAQSKAADALKSEISLKEAQVSKKQGYIESLDPPFDEYKRLNDMWLALGNFNLNKDQFFINVWQGEINELKVDLNSLEAQLQALQ